MKIAGGCSEGENEVAVLVFVDISESIRAWNEGLSEDS